MTDRVNALIVVLERDTRDDDVRCLVDAVRQLRGVRSVSTHVADIEAHVAETRAKAHWRARFAAVLWPDDGG